MKAPLPSPEAARGLCEYIRKAHDGVWQQIQQAADDLLQLSRDVRRQMASFYQVFRQSELRGETISFPPTQQAREDLYPASTRLNEFLKSAKVLGRNAPSLLRGKSQLSKLGARSSNG